MMGKSKRIIVLSILAVVLGICLIYFVSTNNAHKTKVITKETAIKEISQIVIIDEEISFMQDLKENYDVKVAVESEQSIDLSVARGKELAAGILPDEITVGEFSVINGVVCFGYFINDNRVILEIFSDNKIRKTIAVYSKNGDVKTVYENFNNETYKKNLL